MTSDRRSTRIVKEDEISNSTKKDLNRKRSVPPASVSGRTDTSGLRSTRETSSRKHMTESPSNVRKSERLEKRMPNTPDVKNKSENDEMQTARSPLRRSDRGKKHSSTSSSGSKNSANGSASSNMKGKKEKNKNNLKQFSADTSNVIRNETQSLEPGVRKRKAMNAHRYKAKFKLQKIRITEAADDKALNILDKLTQVDSGSNRDIYDEVEKSDQLLQIDCSSNGGSGSKSLDGKDHGGGHYSVRQGKELVEECVERASEGPIGVVVSDLKSLDVAVEVEASCSSRNLRFTEEHNGSVDKDGTGGSENIGTAEEILDDASAVLVDISKMDLGPPEFVSSLSAGKSPDGGLGNCCSEDAGSGSRNQSSNRNVHTSKKNSDSCAVITNKDNQTSTVDAAASPLFKKHDSGETCATCFEKSRLDHNLGKHESVCSCHTTLAKRLCVTSIPKERGRYEQSAAVELEGNDNATTPRKETSTDVQVDCSETMCIVCKLGGKLILCDGKGCKRSYHPSCLDPHLDNVPPRVWHCPNCVEKKIKSGVQSVSEGIESIWDSREVEVSNAEGSRKQKQYLVKYKGLAHVHNQWIPAPQLLLEAPLLLKKFDRKNQVVKYNTQWTVPHRLLKRRLLVSLKKQNEYNSKHPDKIVKCHYEWLVKWRSLSYEDATWELENASFLCSTEGQHLIRDYENRFGKRNGAATVATPDKTEKKSTVILSELPADCPPGTGNSHLKYVNKLLEYWSKGQNVAVFDYQDRVTRVIIFILSVKNFFHPFLVITTHSNMMLWENEFSRLASSINFVVYNGNKENRESIRILEFYSEDNQITFQVLISSVQAFVEDIKMLETIRWEAVIVDDCRRPTVSFPFQQIKSLLTDTRMLLFSSPLKENVTEHRNVLSLLGFDDNLVDVTGSKTMSDDNLGSLRECLSQFTAYDCISFSSRFVEYWVPVQMSNMQLEQYCATLLSNTMALCSCSKNDPVGALRDILLSSLKCCDHPYIVDPLLQSLVTKDLPPAEYLDIGIEASGKLQLLDILLSSLKRQQLKVLILFQPISGTGKEPISIGDILDDFVRQRFGQDSYERVDGGVIVSSKRQAALNNFNQDKARFIFLLEHRACLQSIKLSSVDAIIIYDSDMNPMNDLRALQKITIDAQPRQIKVFRLYVCCTAEEGILLKADHNLLLDSKLQNLSRSTNDTLIMWGASYLFSKLDKFHSSSISTISCEQSELNRVVAEILDIISENSVSKDTTNSVITRAELSGRSYSKNITLLGKLKVQLQEREQPNIFWRKLLDGRNPRWKYLSGSSPRQRKRIHYSEDSSRKTDLGYVEVAKKQKKMVVNCADPALLNPVVKEGTAGVPANFVTHSVPTERLESTEVQQEASLAENSHYSLLKLDVSRLCQILKLSEEINAMIGKFLMYIIQNHRVCSEPPSILQAFLISLCWIGASLLKHKIDKKESIGLAKQHMKFNCTEEEIISVYSKLKQLKAMFLSNSENILEPDSANDSQRTSDSTATKPLDLSTSNSASLNLQGVKVKIEGEPPSQYVGEKLILAKQGQLASFGIAKKDALESRKHAQNKTENQMLVEKHQKELEELNFRWENKKLALQKVHLADSALIRVLYSVLAVRLGKLKALDNEFAKKMEEHKRQRDIDLEDLKARHLAEVRQTTVYGSEEANLSNSEGRAQNGPTSHETRKQVENSEACEYITQSGPENVLSLSRHHTQRQSLDEVGNNLHLNRVVEDDICETSLDGAAGCNILTEEATILVTTHSGNDKVETVVSEKGSATTISHPSGGFSGDGADNIVSTSPHLEDQIQLPGDGESAPNEVLECLGSVYMGTPPIESNNEKNGADASEQDMPNAGEMQNDGISSSNGGSAPACDHRLLADLDGQNDSSQPLSCSRMQDEDVQGDGSSSPQVDSPQQPAVSGQCDPSNADGQGEEPPDGVQDVQTDRPQSLSCIRMQDEDVQGDGSASPQVDSPHQPAVSGQRDPSNADGQGEEPPDGVDFMLSANGHHSQSQPNFTQASGVVNLPSFPGQIIPHNSRESHQLAEECAEFSDNVILQDEENLEAHSLTDAELPIEGNQPEGSRGDTLDDQPPIEENQPEGSGGDTLYHQPLEELQNSSQNVEALPQAVEATAQLPSLSGLHTGPNSPIVQGSDNQYEVHVQMSPGALSSAEPLQIELERLRKDKEHVVKIHEEMKLRLKSECEKEIAEVVAQIQSKYETKRREEEAEFLLKRKELDANHNKVFMNKVLADAFRSKCLDLRPSGAMGLQHAVPSSFLQQLRQLSMQAQRPGPAVASSAAVAPRPGPAVASSAAVQPSSASQHTTTAPPLQIVNYPAALFSSSSTRPPPNINPITPSAGNFRGGGEIRAPAPHIQPFKPSTSASPSSLPSLTRQGSLPAASPPAPLSANLHCQHTASSPSISCDLHPLLSSRIPPSSTSHLPAVSPTTAGASSQQRSRSSSPSANLSGHPSLQRSGSLSGTSPSLPQASFRPPPPQRPTSSSDHHMPIRLPSSSLPPLETSPAVASQPSIQPVSIPSELAQPSMLPPIRDTTFLQSLNIPNSFQASFLSQLQSLPTLPSLPPLLASPSGLYNKPPQLQTPETSSTPNNLNASSSMGLFTENNNQAGETQPNSFPPLPNFGPNFESWDLYQYGTPVNEPACSAPLTVTTDVVCLSDDD